MRLSDCAVAGPLIAAALALTGCDFDDTVGLDTPCAEASGSGLGCEPFPVETAEDACWKMVECSAIPVESSDSFDWDRCVSYLRGLESFRQEFSLACIEGAQCDELKFSGSPDSPSRNPANFPPCLQHGDQ